MVQVVGKMLDSSVNGTSARFKFVASGTPTSFSGNDANGNSLSIMMLDL